MGALAKIAMKGLAQVIQKSGKLGTKIAGTKAGQQALGKVPGTALVPAGTTVAKSGKIASAIEKIKANPLKTLVFGAGGLGLLSSMFGGSDDGGDNEWLHKAPEAGRTVFYPVTGNGNYDDVAHVDSYDSNTANLNTATFGYDTERVRSFCDGPCSQGCVDTTVIPAQFTEDAYKKYYKDVSDEIDALSNHLNAGAEEPWVQTLIQQRYGSSGDGSLQGFYTQLASVVSLTKPLFETTNKSGTDTHDALRTLVKNIRANLATGYASSSDGFSWGSTAKSGAIGAALGVFGGPPGMLIGAGSSIAIDGVMSMFGDHKFPDEQVAALSQSWDDAQAAARTSLEENDDAVKKFNSAVEELEYTASPLTSLGSPIFPVEKPKDDIKGDEDKKKNEDNTTPQNPVTTGGTPPAVTPPGTDAKTEDPLDQWNKNTPTPSDNASTSPFSSTPSSGMPSSSMPSSGMPSTGTPMSSSPLGDMTPLSDPSSTPTDAKPEDAEPAAADLFEGTEVPTDDATDPLDDGKEEEKGDEKDGDEKDDDATDPSLVGEPPVHSGDAPAEPTDEQKRTVQLPDGRQVTFPSEKLADMVRTMVASGTENPTSVYQAADSAGMNLPPMGQDIGQPISPMDVREGDIVKGPEGTGVAIGNGEVFMESGEIKPIEEVAKVESSDQGIFRIEDGDSPKGNDLSGAPQQVGDAPPAGTEPPAGDATINANGSQPGMPADNAAPVTQQGTQSDVAPTTGTTDSFSGTDPLEALGL